MLGPLPRRSDTLTGGADDEEYADEGFDDTFEDYDDEEEEGAGSPGAWVCVQAGATALRSSAQLCVLWPSALCSKGPAIPPAGHARCRRTQPSPARSAVRLLRADPGRIACCARGRTSLVRLVAISAHREKERATPASGGVWGTEWTQVLGRPLQAIHAKRPTAVGRRLRVQRHRGCSPAPSRHTVRVSTPRGNRSGVDGPCSRSCAVTLAYRHRCTCRTTGGGAAGLRSTALTDADRHGRSGRACSGGRKLRERVSARHDRPRCAQRL
jgi:hypothetical protein